MDAVTPKHVERDFGDQIFIGSTAKGFGTFALAFDLAVQRRGTSLGEFLYLQLQNRTYSRGRKWASESKAKDIESWSQVL